MQQQASKVLKTNGRELQQTVLIEIDICLHLIQSIELMGPIPGFHARIEQF